MGEAISVVIPTFNRYLILNRSINSVLSAISETDEVIIVDDGSQDETKLIVESYGDHRLRYLRQPNSGVSVARNKGMEVAKNDLIAFIDDDDEWHPQKLNIQRELLNKHPSAVASFTNFSTTDKNGKLHKNYIFKWGQPVKNWCSLLGESMEITSSAFDKPICYYLGEHYLNQMGGDYILPSSLLINRKRFKEDLVFRAGMQRNESWLFSSQVCRQGPILYVDVDLVCQHGDAINRLTDIPEVETVLSRVFVLENEFAKSNFIKVEHEKKLSKCLSSELNNLFLGALRLEPGERLKVMRENAFRGGKFYFASVSPSPVLSLYFFIRRCLRYVLRHNPLRKASV